ncbi:hypothetical protein LLH06_11625 [Mucilaginibacter daejeonensis]|uniref:hypothetical protein n=1 Tax=Mucilaginibacter daejeonensis TaxID=398049 RepID=UPI001D172721|nr:hypothetical protein [Mucilaginibacter daejeonensis]UEG51619.1 hypothetical protein LLH06_11625 [Mucilaginibacter daejeonensis]
MRPVLLLSLLLWLFNSPPHTGSRQAFYTDKSNVSVGKHSNDQPKLMERFADSLHIGRKGKAKVEINKYRLADSTYVTVKFFIRKGSAWSLRNDLSYPCDAPGGLETQLSDFNNDRLNDLTFVSAASAKGANEVRRLFIYNDKRQQLIPIINSQDYPNMLYNKQLNCIDAYLVYGGSSTVFARLQGNRLSTFARVDNMDNYSKVYVISPSGRERLIRKDKLNDPDDANIRYVNYKPLQANE